MERWEKTYIIKYNATPKNGKPFVINEILARLYTFSRCRVRVGLVEGKCDFTSLWHDDIFIFLLPTTTTFFRASKNIISFKRCVSKELIRDFTSSLTYPVGSFSLKDSWWMHVLCWLQLLITKRWNFLCRKVYFSSKLHLKAWWSSSRTFYGSNGFYATTFNWMPWPLS